jgi:acyl-CoA thioesterase-1
MMLMTASAGGAAAPTILVFGDSLSAGYGIEVDQSWVSLLQARLKEQGYEHQVINASISGETTEGGATRIEAALTDFSPRLIILELGGNDGLRGIPAARMQSNLEKIVMRAKASGAAVVLLGIRIPSNYGPRYSAEFEAVFRQVSADLGVQWIEFFMEGIALNDELLQDDRIHPNVVAQPMLLDNAWPIISATLNE